MSKYDFGYNIEENRTNRMASKMLKSIPEF